MALTFQRLRIVSRHRANDCAQPVSNRTPEWWSNAMAGECGEACNITKKMSRLSTGDGNWNKLADRDATALKERLACEIADVVIYADLLAERIGVDLDEYIIKVFNKKSEEIGSHWRI